MPKTSQKNWPALNLCHMDSSIQPFLYTTTPLHYMLLEYMKLRNAWSRTSPWPWSNKAFRKSDIQHKISSNFLAYISNTFRLLFFNVHIWVIDMSCKKNYITTNNNVCNKTFGINNHWSPASWKPTMHHKYPHDTKSTYWRAL